MTTALRNTVATMDATTISGFRAAVSDSFVPLQVTSSHADRFRGVIRAVGVNDVDLTDVRATDHVVERTPELIARGDQPYYKVSMMLGGHGLLLQDDREAVLRPGDFAVYDTSRPYTLVFEERFHALVIMLPHNLLAMPPDMVAQLTAVRMAGDTGLGAMVFPYLSQLAGNFDQIAGTTGARLVNSAIDLVTTMLAHELGFDGCSPDPHRALLQRIRGYIDRNLASTDLGPTSIAAAHYISTRHLHGLFQEQSTTVSTWIRTRRLERCRRDLVDPLLADRSVAAIAARWGLVDAAHFSRAFKVAYGVSPREFRTPR